MRYCLAWDEADVRDIPTNKTTAGITSLVSRPSTNIEEGVSAVPSLAAAFAFCISRSACRRGRPAKNDVTYELSCRQARNANSFYFFLSLPPTDAMHQRIQVGNECRCRSVPVAAFRPPMHAGTTTTPPADTNFQNWCPLTSLGRPIHRLPRASARVESSRAFILLST